MLHDVDTDLPSGLQWILQITVRGRVGTQTEWKAVRLSEGAYLSIFSLFCRQWVMSFLQRRFSWLPNALPDGLRSNWGQTPVFTLIPHEGRAGLCTQSNVTSLDGVPLIQQVQPRGCRLWNCRAAQFARRKKMTALLLSTWTLFEFVLLDSIVLVTLVTKLRHQTI